MKKILSFLILAVTAIQFAFAGDVVTKDEMKLPLQARNFIKEHFVGSQISYIKIETEFMKKKYDVLLTSGTEIDFDNKGNWTDVDCKKAAVPEAIVPAAIREYVKAHFKNEFITQIERKGYGYEIELNNDLNVLFDKKGNFRKLDD